MLISDEMVISMGKSYGFSRINVVQYSDRQGRDILEIYVYLGKLGARSSHRLDCFDSLNFNSLFDDLLGYLTNAYKEGK